MMTENDQMAHPSASERELVATSSGSVNVSSVFGWGVDADPANDPTYPYRDRTDDDHRGEWVRPPQQESDVELLRSIEHKRLPAVFGSSSPPRGVSGGIRRLAFRWSESHWAHWLLLMGADRVDMVEGIIDDLVNAKIPNVPAEMGVKAEWRYDRTGLIAKVAIGALVGATIVSWIRPRKR
jgi:hypothetical protein